MRVVWAMVMMAAGCASDGGDRCRDNTRRVAPDDEVFGVTAEARDAVLDRLPASAEVPLQDQEGELHTLTLSLTLDRTRTRALTRYLDHPALVGGAVCTRAFEVDAEVRGEVAGAWTGTFFGPATVVLGVDDADRLGDGLVRLDDEDARVSPAVPEEVFVLGEGGTLDATGVRLFTYGDGQGGWIGTDVEAVGQITGASGTELVQYATWLTQVESDE